MTLIPPRAHFCWIGAKLPWAYVFAVLSAAEHSALPEIILHHTDALEDGAELRALQARPGVRLDRLDPLAYLAETGGELGLGEGLATLYRAISNPAARADILRAAILYRQGGVYLDMDTITTASLRPLLETRQFVGTEYIVWPKWVRRSRSPVVWARHLTLDVVRKLLRRLPSGWRAFRHVERFYFSGVNNAVMGAEAGSSFCAAYLRAMLAVPLGQVAQPYALGPDLLQSVVAHYPRAELTLCPPEAFYPLPPEISEHWFRIGKTANLAAVLLPGTRVVHWYASVRTKSRVAQISPEYVRAHRAHQLYSALVCACLPNLPEML
jgi:hypothetical protein